MIGDKVVHHFQAIEEGLFVVRFAPEIKPDSIKDFFALNSVEVGFFFFFLSYFLKLATPLTMRPKLVKVATTTGFKVMPPATAEVTIALPATIL